MKFYIHYKDQQHTQPLGVMDTEFVGIRIYILLDEHRGDKQILKRLAPRFDLIKWIIIINTKVYLLLLLNKNF